VAAPPQCLTNLVANVFAGNPTVLPAAPCNDPDGDALTIILVDGPGHGVLGPQAADGTRTYTADASYVGNDVVHFKASDGTSESGVSTLTINVQPPPSCEPCTRPRPSDIPLTVINLAPQVVLYSGDKAAPDDPSEFFERSRLRWYNRDPGPEFRVCGPQSERWTVTKQPTFDGILSGQYSAKVCLQRRLNPRRYGPKQWKRFSSARLTAPASQGNSAKVPPGRLGFYLDVADYRKSGIAPVDSTYSNAPTMYYEYAPQRFIVYWFFYSSNDRRGDKHEGDWEHIKVTLKDEDSPADVTYFTHYCSHRHSWNEMQARGWLVDSTHPQVFSARGGHGSWPNDGKTLKPCPDWKQGAYDVRSEGPRWSPWRRDGGLADAQVQSWYGLGVGWGRDGGIGWGPLGPSRWASAS
jgi:hypothetical protein